MRAHVTAVVAWPVAWPVAAAPHPPTQSARACVRVCLPQARGRRPNHKADFLRYALLFVHGGDYLDIETALVRPLDDVFSPADRSYSVTSASGHGIMQGILHAPRARSPFYRRLLERMLSAPDTNVHDYYTVQFEEELRSEPPRAWTLLSERCPRGRNASRLPFCNGFTDKFGYCCFVVNADGRVEFLVRFASFAHTSARTGARAWK